MIDRHIILASNSPRRRELLHYIVDNFDIAPSRDIDETYPADTAPDDVPCYLSRLKADAYADLVAADTVLITADTVVILDSVILGKPHSRDRAIAMLHQLSGRTHRVVTGVTLLTANRSVTFSTTTHVTFDTLSDDEIEYYVDRYQPYDKAGAYGIQEGLGAASVSHLDGCYYNVMGLPLNALYRQLKNIL